MSKFVPGDMICPKKDHQCITWDYLYPKQEVGRIFQHQIALVIGNIKTYDLHGDLEFDDIVVVVNGSVTRLPMCIAREYVKKIM